MSRNLVPDKTITLRRNPRTFMQQCAGFLIVNHCADDMTTPGWGYHVTGRSVAPHAELRHIFVHSFSGLCE